MRRLLTIIVILATTLSTHAVLKEKDLPQTLQILRSELVNYHRELTGMIELNRKHAAQQMTRNEHDTMRLYMRMSTLMLFSSIIR